MKLITRVTSPDESGVQPEVQQILTSTLNSIEMRYVPAQRAIWCTLRARQTPTLTIEMLKDIRSVQDSIAKYCFKNPAIQPKYLIWQSDSNKIFNLGLDLHYLHTLITERDRDKLEEYLQLCIDVLYINLLKLDIKPLITISLIKGKAYGGGFEAAISSDIIIAESNARFCFPEIRRHMLPSLGTLNMLLRRFPPHTIQPLVFKGACLNAHSMHQAGVIEAVVEPGMGIHYVREKINQLDNRHEIYAELYDLTIRNIVVTHAELDKFKKAWLDSILHLGERELRMLKRLADIQHKVIL